MADLFLSYAHQDTKRAETLAKLLEASGLTVWWDRRMVAGDKIHDVIDEEIEKAKFAIVLWSRVSVKSDWVRGEAQTAHELTKLVPIKLEECKLPINYRVIHTPEVYNSKVKLNKFANTLSDKLGVKIEFTDKSSANFLTKLASQKAAYDSEAGPLGPRTMGEWGRLIKKYPLGSMPTIVV